MQTFSLTTQCRLDVAPGTTTSDDLSCVSGSEPLLIVLPWGGPGFTPTAGVQSAVRLGAPDCDPGCAEALPREPLVLLILSELLSSPTFRF